MDLEVALGVIAGWADLGGLLAHHDVAAVAALPHLDLALGKDLRHLHIVQQGAVTLLVVLLDGGHQTEPLRQLVEALLLGGPGKALVHIRPLVVLALSGRQQVLRCVADAVELLEPELRVLLFVLRSFEEQRRDLLVAVLLGLRSKTGVLAARLGFAGKRRHQVLFRLCAFVLILFHESFLLVPAVA